MGVGQARLGGKASEFDRLKMHTGVLCFDEININDPFTALALKGKLILSHSFPVRLSYVASHFCSLSYIA